MHDNSNTESAPPATRLAAVSDRSFPVAALVHLATFCAALLACIDGRTLQAAVAGLADEPPSGRVEVIGALLAGGVLGALVGLGQLKVWSGAVKGFCSGALCGAVILGVYTAPSSLERALAAPMLVLLAPIAMRLRSA